MLDQFEYWIAQEMDGRRDIAALTQALQAVLQGITHERVEQVATKLAHMDLLMNSGSLGAMAPIIPLPVQHRGRTRSDDFDDEAPTSLTNANALAGMNTPFEDDRAFDDDGTDIVPPTFLDDEHVVSSAPRTVDARYVPPQRVATPHPGLPAAPPPTPPEPAPPPAAPPEPAPPAPPPAAAASDAKGPAWEVEKPPWYKRKRPRRLMVLGGFVVVLLALALIPYPLYVTEPCVVSPIDRAEVRAQISGIIAEVFVRDGEKVEIGTPLARLDDRELTYRLRQAQAEAERFQANLDKVKSGSRPQEIRRARAVVAARAQDVRFAEIEARRQQKLFNAGAASAMQRDGARRDLEVKRAVLAEAQSELRLIQAGARDEEVTIAEAELRKVQAEIDFLKRQMDGLVIRSPIAGQVLTPRVHEQLHKRLEPGDIVCEIGNEETVRVDIFVPEGEADVVRVGQPVTVKVKFLPLESFEGRISHIAPAVEEIDGQRVIRVETVLDNPNKLLKPRMSGYAEIDTGTRPLGVRVFRRAIRWLRVRFLL